MQPNSNLTKAEEYLICIDGLPPGLSQVRENKKWGIVKDKIRRLAPYHIDTPRVDVLNGLGWVSRFRDGDAAWEIYSRVQGHIWEQYTLTAWLLKDWVQIAGPIDPVSNQTVLAPLFKTPALAPVVRHTNSKKDPVAAAARDVASSDQCKSHHRVSPSKGSGQRTPASGAEITNLSDHLSNTRINLSNPHPAAMPARKQRIALSRRGKPTLWSSSRTSSTSTLSSASWSMVDMSEHSTMPSLFMTPSLAGAAFISERTIDPGATTTDQSTYSYVEAPINSPFPNEYSAPDRPSACLPTQEHKVLVKNLSLDATEQLVYNLIEQNTRVYVPLVLPSPIVLHKDKGQFHAYIKFVDRSDAEKVVQQLDKSHFMGKKLQAALEEATSNNKGVPTS